MPRERDRPPRVLGTDLGNVRQHPAYESAGAPPRNVTPWPPEIRRAPRTPTITPPAPASVRPTRPQWATGIVAVITALGTMFGGLGWAVTEYRKTVAIEATRSAERFDRLEKLVGMILDDQKTRDVAQLAVLCALNGGPPAPNVRCPPTACAPPALGVDGKPFPGQPICRAVVDWPPPR